MTITTANRHEIIESLTDKAYRDAFVSAEIATTLPLQIKAMRKARGWNQKRLAAAAAMTQGRISILENPDYEGAVNVRTLEKLASAFDVGLVVRFVPFSEIVDWTSRLTAQSHNVPEYSKDKWLRGPTSPVQAMAVTDALSAVTSNYISTELTDPMVDRFKTIATVHMDTLGQSEQAATSVQAVDTVLADVA